MKTLADLPIVTAAGLRPDARALLRPGELTACADGRRHRLPHSFLEVPSWAAARSTPLSPHFNLSELMLVDCREHDELLHGWPHYVPCSVFVFASYLEAFRRKVGASVYIAANGGYRSPAHQRAGVPGPHCWGCAVDIYRVGNTFLDAPEAIRKFAAIASELRSEWNVKSEHTDDHLHLDLGYLQWSPAGFDDA